VDKDGTKDHERDNGLNQRRKVFCLAGGRILRARENSGGETGNKDGTYNVT